MNVLRVLPGSIDSLPPHSLDAEKTVLGSCLLKPDLLRDMDLAREDFYSDANGRIWSAMQYLAAEGVPVDGVTLRQRLVELSQLPLVGGDDYLLGLTDIIPTIENAHASIVRRLARQRAAQAHAARGARSAAAGDLVDAQTALRASQRALDEAEQKPRVAWSFAADAVATVLKPVGQRLRTSFDTLDDATRGGIPMGRFVVLAGAPGASKTTLSVYLADRWERAGATVVYLAADEPQAGILVRFGQLMGWSREGLEEEGPIGDATRAGFAQRLRGRRLVTLDPDESGMTIEDAATVLDEAASGPLRVLVVDSLQTARCAAAAGLESARERMDAVVKVCKRIARAGVLVLAVSEMSRAGYAGREPANPLASAKESGAIEYGVSLFMAMRSVRDVKGQFDVEVAKNRLGGDKPTFRLRLDFSSAALSEIAAPSEPPPAAARDAGQAYHEAVRQVLAKARSPLSGSSISRVAEKSKEGILAALAQLEHSGEVLRLSNGYWLSVRGEPSG